MQPERRPLSSEEQSFQLMQRLEQLGSIGARQDGGVDRQAYSAGERDAIRLIVGWAREAGCRALADRAGNLFLRLDPHTSTHAGLPPVVSGSHIDTQPRAGKYDGTYGVLAALSALEAISAADVVRTHPLEVAIWMNEEGCRFAPGAMGSAVHTGHLALEDTLGSEDAAGITLAQELQRHLALYADLGVEPCPLQRPMRAYIEAHIEQGPVLDAEEKCAAAVSGIQGARWFTVEVRGRAGHAGTTPRALRADALECASDLASRMRALCRDDDDLLRFTIGRFEVSPGSINTIPDLVRFTIDLRNGDESVLEQKEAGIRALVASMQEPCKATLTREMHLKPTIFDRDLVSRLQKAVQAAGGATAPMLSGAFHDASNLARHCPSAMLFIACAGGVSHHPDESITLQNAGIGAEVLMNVMRELLE